MELQTGLTNLRQKDHRWIMGFSHVSSPQRGIMAPH